MFILSGTITLVDGSTISGAVIKDGGLATVVSAGRLVRYVGDVMYAANAGLSDLATGQDLVTRLYNSNSSFVSFIAALLAAGMTGTANTPSVSTTIRESVWQFAAHLPSGEYLRVLGSSDGEPSIRSGNLAAAITLLDADGDFAPPTGIMAGVIT